jgi:eukaryotic-like serine/threonine-protein kinase
VASVTGELIGRVIADRFRLEALVGRGAAAEVYLAVDTRLKRRVAVKVLHNGVASDQQFLRRFRSEAQLASRLTHPNILIIHDWHDGRSSSGNESADPAHLITEYLDGGSLRSMLDKHHRLSLSQTTLVGIEAARGLVYAHAQGIVHRDIKPANLLFASDGSLRIGDFGLARALAEAAMTEPEGALVGTARYAAPEQITTGSVDGKADVYSLAVTLIEAATGSAPFRADTPLGVLMARHREPLIPPPELGALAEALAPAGTVDPNERIDAATLLRNLERITRKLPRPEPLPIVLPGEVRVLSNIDPTVHAGAELRTPLIDLTKPDVAGSEFDRPESDRTESAPSVSDSSVSDPSVSDSPVSDSPRPKPDLPVPQLIDLASGLGEQNEPFGPRQSSASNEASEHGGRSIRRRALFLGGIGLLGGAAFGGVQWWSGRPEYRTVPALVGLNQENARQQVIDADLAWQVQTVADEQVPAGTVIRATPGAGSSVLRGESVQVVVSGGPSPRPVPLLVGLDETAALAALGEVQLRGEITQRTFDEVVAAGIVMSADPSSGSVSRDSAVRLVVSQGPEPRVVPNVSGMTPDAAKAALPDGLTGVITEEASDTVAKGIVIAANYKPGSRLDRGSSVRIRVSSGPPLIEIPATKGLDASSAATRLKAAGFVVQGTEGAPDQPVAGTRPPAGRAVRKGTAVVIITTGGASGTSGTASASSIAPRATTAPASGGG